LLTEDSLKEIGGFPYDPSAEGPAYQGDTLFIKGSRTDLYLKEKYKKRIEGFFPHYQWSEIDAGHWVASEKPHEFINVVTDFINRPS